MNPSNLPRTFDAIQLPPAIAVWVGLIVYIFLGLLILWIVFKSIGFFMRRAYNLTPAATARSKDLKPDFLKVDYVQREKLIERGRQFDLVHEAPIEKVVKATRFGVILSALVTFGAAAFLAVGRIEEFDQTWRKLSAFHKFGAILRSHPFGFGIAILVIMVGLIRLILTVRKKH